MVRDSADTYDPLITWFVHRTDIVNIPSWKAEVIEFHLHYAKVNAKESIFLCRFRPNFNEPLDYLLSL